MCAAGARLCRLPRTTAQLHLACSRSHKAGSPCTSHLCSRAAGAWRWRLPCAMCWTDGSWTTRRMRSCCGCAERRRVAACRGVAARPAHACGVCAVCMVRLPTLSSVQALQSNPPPCALPPAAPAEPATPAAGAPHGGGHALPSPAAQHPAQRAAARGCGHVPAVSGCAFTHEASWEACLSVEVNAAWRLPFGDVVRCLR